MGCSYTHWYDTGRGPGYTYPGILANARSDIRVIDVSFPGLANSAFFMRLNAAERLYGKPDLVIAQWTHPTRDIWVRDDVFKIDLESKVNYTYSSPDHTKLPFISRTISNYTKNTDRLADALGIPESTVVSYLNGYMTSDTLPWITYKEWQLVNSYFDNVINFQFKEDVCIPNSVITVTHVLENIQEVSIDEHAHLTFEGHQLLYGMLQTYIGKYL